jgi:hypothetical protein
MKFHVHEPTIRWPLLSPSADRVLP